MAAPIWKHFRCSKTQLCINTVLNCGQSFRWKKNSEGEWMGVMAGLVWRMKQMDDRILYQVYGSKSKDLPEAAVKHPEDNVLIMPKKDIENEFKLIDTSETISHSERKPESDMNMDKDIKTEITCQHESVSSHSRMEPASARITRKRSSQMDVGKTKKMKKPERDMGMNGHMTAPIHEPITEGIFGQCNTNSKESHDEHLSLLQDYFQLGIDLDDLYRHWSSRDPHFRRVAGNFHGIRILRQDPVENLISFVCSSNNHISRISSMIEKLCNHYGNFIATVDDVDYHAFPTLPSLCGVNVESNLRQLGFGYRAKFIANIAKHIVQDKGEGWVESLRGRPYPEAKAELMTLLGVGAKVADCVCLMSLDQPGAVPVDTHVWQITMKNYMAKLQSAKSLTEKLYNEIGEFYRNLWGPYAGWAHSVLFTADLRHNKTRETKAPVNKNNAVKAQKPPVTDQAEDSSSVTGSGPKKTRGKRK